MIDILERFLQQINLHRNPINRITYNVVSSTAAAEYIRSMEGNDGDCDSMILISLCYGKQVPVTEARAKEESASADGFAGSAFADEVLLHDVEQLKHLLPYDLGLSEKDCAWHSPLMVFAQLKALKNMRIRSQQSEDRRRERWGGLNENTRRNVMSLELNAVRKRIVFRLCGQILLNMSVKPDLVPSAEQEAEIRPHAFQSRHRHQ